MNASKSSCQCFNTIQFPIFDVFAPNYSGIIDTISDESWAGHFVILNNLIVGNSYTFTSSNLNDFLTIRNTGGIASDPTVSFGSSPLTFIASSHRLEVHINLLSPPCGGEDINRTTLIGCDNCPIEPLKVGIQTTNPKAILDVAGEIKIGDVNLNAEAGMIRFNSTTSDFEGYNGQHWVSLTKPNGKWGKVPSGMTVEDYKITVNDGENFDGFGFAVSIDGDYAVIGSHLDNINGNIDQGSAYVFKRSGTSWTQEAKLNAEDGVALDFFGISVSIDGDYVLIGCYGDGIGSIPSQGSAYVFKRSGTFWNQEAKLTANDGASNDFFGRSVSINGDRAVIGSYLDNIDGIVNQGSVYVFKRSGTIWTQESKLTAGDGATNDGFGIAVAIDGDYVVAGSDRDDIGFSTDQGSAYVFKRSGTSWNQEAKLIANSGATDDTFGVSVSIAGDYAVIGSKFDDIGSNTDQGSAYIFKRSGTSWTQEEKLIAADGTFDDHLGITVSIDGDYAVVGSSLDNIDGNNDQGSAYIFKRSGTSWTQEAKLTTGDAGNGTANDQFGISVSIAGDYVVIGSNTDDIGSNMNQGSAYIFLHK